MASQSEEYYRARDALHMCVNNIEQDKLFLYMLILGLGCAADSISIASISYVMAELKGLPIEARGIFIFLFYCS